jgi:hypothetical protein
MTALTPQQQQDTARFWANVAFVQAQATAKYSLDQIQAAVAAVDNAFDTTLANAVIAVGGATTIANGLSSQITGNMPAATAQQQTLVVCYTLMKRAGII